MLLVKEGHGWFIVAVKKSQEVALLYLRHVLDAHTRFADLPPAPAEAFDAARRVVDALTDPTKEAPLRLGLVAERATLINPKLTKSAALPEAALRRFAVAIEFRFEHPRQPEERWVMFRDERGVPTPYLQVAPPTLGDLCHGLTFT